MSAASLEVKGLREAQAKTEQLVRQMQGGAMLQAMRDATMAIDRDAKRNAPVDTGRLRASITPEIRMDGHEIIGVVGSNVVYAPFMELGTRPHFPPLGALTVWARRHGTTAFVVARAIARKGTKARRFLQNAFEKNAQYAYNRFKKAVEDMLKA